MSLSPVDIRYFKQAVGAFISSETDSDISAKCPICGDSKKKHAKARLHLYEKNNMTFINCFNEGCAAQNKNVYSFLRDLFPELLPAYKKETFNDTISDIKESRNKDSEWSLKDLLSDLAKTEPVEEVCPVLTQDLSMYFDDISGTPGVNYLLNRNIIYDESFGKWYFGKQNLEISGTFYNLVSNVIVPLYYKDEMYGFYSRSIDKKDFVTYMNDVNVGYKVWNWFNVNKSEPVYIFEGIFDAISSGEKNIIALLGARLPDDRLKELNNPVFCLDNDRTGINNMIKYAKMGYTVYVQPNDLHEKDMNELVLSHGSVNIKDNLYTGLSAITRLKAKL